MPHRNTVFRNAGRVDGHATRKRRQDLRDCVRLIDSTTVELSSLSEE